jgi:hypothetical protein
MSTTSNELKVPDSSSVTAPATGDSAGAAAQPLHDAFGPRQGQTATPTDEAENLSPETLAARLVSESDPEEVWRHLCLAERFSPRRIGADAIYRALCRAAEADSPFIRFSAYSRLARFYRVDLRYDNSARLTLGQRLQHETGALKERLASLL